MVRSGGSAVGAVRNKFPAVAFPEPPVKRLYPWSNDNHFNTDIIVGKVKTTCGSDAGFDGFVLKDVQLHTIIRFFQLAKSHLPETITRDIWDAGDAVREGFPTLVVTRGVYGRELDPSEGPASNGAQARIWETVRAIRAENPRMCVSLVDVPAAMTTEELSQCLQPPLDIHRELAYYDGVWFAPKEKSAKAVLKHLQSYPRKSLYKHSSIKAKIGPTYEQKSFPISTAPSNDISDGLWTLVWEPVHTDEDFVPPIVDIARLALDSSGRCDMVQNVFESDNVDASWVREVVSTEWHRGNSTHGGLQKRAVQRLLNVVDELIAKRPDASHAWKDNARVVAAEHVAELLKSGDDRLQEAVALKALVKAKIAKADVAGGLQTLSVLRALHQKLDDSFGEATAVEVAVLSLLVNGHVETAIETALEVSQQLSSVGESRAKVLVLDTLVRSYLAAGKNEEALGAARNAEAHFQSLDDKRGEASALGAIAGTFASMGDLDQAISFHRRALSIHKEVRARMAVARSMQALGFVFLTKGDRREAISITAELAALTVEASEPELKGIALKLHAILLMALADRWPRDGQEYAVAAVDASEKALELTAESDDLAGQALSAEVLAKALKFVGRVEEAQVAARKAVALYNEAGETGAPLASSLICSAQCNVVAKKMHSAMWDAKKALVHATAGKDAALQKGALSLIEDIGRGNSSLACLGSDVRRT